MRVLALVPSQRGYAPGQRGSVELWERVLEPAGIKLEFAPFESPRLQQILYQSGRNLAKVVETVRGYANRLELVRRIDEYDAVLIYREAALLGPAFFERSIAKRKPLIYQLDDPLFMPYRSPSNGYLSYLKFFGKIKEIIRISKVVIVNSSQIREYAEQYNQNIWQVPSVVDTDKFTFKPFPEDPERVCVGWSGSPTTLENLKLVERPLQEISKNGICDIHFIGGLDLGLKDVEYTSQRWNEDSEVEDLRRLQVGLVPLPENSWNRYKFIMKTAQYMALGIVPVGTPMASNPEVIRHGENGFLAATDDEWVEYLTLLVKDHKLRNRLSHNAARDAAEKYSLEANKGKIIAAFRAAVARI
jgi:glycosyltransferase involved in cell wall biosynthesis